MRKNYFLTVDTETTMDDMVADFAATITDKKGRIVAQCAVLVRGIYNDPVNHPLFHNEQSGELWKKESLGKRYNAYDEQLENGSRMLASIHAINIWLMTAKAQYDPILTAYNLPFDIGKSRNTGINLDVFTKRFCLWSASVTAYAKKKKYKQFILDHHLFKPVTALGNMSFPTNAETMARFILGDIKIPDEPHTALEDIIGYELPILNHILRRKTTKWLLTEVKPYAWQHYQVKDHFKPA